VLRPVHDAGVIEIKPCLSFFFFLFFPFLRYEGKGHGNSETAGMASTSFSKLQF
jgi:hypothetical protein